MSAAAKTDPTIAEFVTVIERVRCENRGTVESWIAGLRQERLKERLAEWRKSRVDLPDSDRIKELLVSEDTHS